MGDLLGLRLEYEGHEVIVPDGTTAVIGSDPDATVRVARPGISRRHALVNNEGRTWTVRDASSRNGTYHDGTRIQALDVTSVTTIKLGHPQDGPAITIGPTDASQPVPKPVSPGAASSAPTKVEPVAPQPSAVTPPSQAPATADLDELASALRDMMKSVRGLTWSVWAMIAVTAILALLTLFVGIVGS